MAVWIMAVAVAGNIEASGSSGKCALALEMFVPDHFHW